MGLFGKQSSDCRSMDGMLNCRRLLVLMGTVVWSRYTHSMLLYMLFSLPLQLPIIYRQSWLCLCKTV